MTSQLRSAGPGVATPRRVVDHLAERRYVVSGDRAYLIGTTDGRFPRMGWHTRGEMGGVWTPPIKILDGYWLSIDDRPLSQASAFETHPGHVEFTYPEIDGIELARAEAIPDDLPGCIVGITLRNPNRRMRIVRLGLRVRSKLIAADPWSDGRPAATEAECRDVALIKDETTLRFESAATGWRALVSTSTPPNAMSVVPPGNGDGIDPSALPGGAWGGFEWVLRVRPGAPVTLWVAIGGTHRPTEDVAPALRSALADPRRLLSRKAAARRELLGRSTITGLDPDLAASFDAAKLNLADLRRTVPHVRLRDRRTDDEEVSRSAPDELRGVGAGFPDYPHFFGGDGCYAAYGLIVCGQWQSAMDHLRLLRDASRAVNGPTGKVVHEVAFDGTVTYGANRDAGDADETPLVASAVELIWRWSGDASFRDEMYSFVRDGMRHLVDELDPDRDGYPAGEGGTERAGAGEETLTVCVTTWQGLRALARLASDRGDSGTAAWASARATRIETTFDRDWWIPDAGLYADSLDRENRPVLQRHWVGIMPMAAGLAPSGHAVTALTNLESAASSGPSGLFHTGGGRAAFDDADHRVWTIANGLMAVAEANYGRLEQAVRYLRPLADAIDIEMPGALPEVLPSPGYEVYGDLLDRLMFLQAWSAYGAQWPLIHHFLGIRPDIPGGVLSVVPHLPRELPRLSVRDLRVGDAAISVTARRQRGVQRTAVDVPRAWRTFLGVRLSGADVVGAVELDGRAVRFETFESTEGDAVGVWVDGPGRHAVAVMLV